MTMINGICDWKIYGFHGILLWDHHGDDRGLIINNGKTYIQ